MNRVKYGFTTGDRVRFSPEWRGRTDTSLDRSGARYCSSKRGTVIGFGRNFPTIRVHWDGHSPRSVYSYHCSFLEADV